MKALRMVSTHSFIMSGVSTRSGICLSLGEAAREMVLEFNAPPETPLEEPPAEFVPAVDQSPQVADCPPQVINEDSAAILAGSDGGADKDDEAIEVDKPVCALSSD